MPAPCTLNDLSLDHLLKVLSTWMHDRPQSVAEFVNLQEDLGEHLTDRVIQTLQNIHPENKLPDTVPGGPMGIFDEKEGKYLLMKPRDIVREWAYQGGAEHDTQPRRLARLVKDKRVEAAVANFLKTAVRGSLVDNMEDWFGPEGGKTSIPLSALCGKGGKRGSPRRRVSPKRQRQKSQSPATAIWISSSRSPSPSPRRKRRTRQPKKKSGGASGQSASAA